MTNPNPPSKPNFEPERGRPRPPLKLSLFVFIDAFGWEILKKYPFAEDLLSYRQPLHTIYGYSSTCDPTIITGKLPREHGHFSFFYYNPKDSPFGLCRPLSLLPKTITRRGRVRRVLSRFLQKAYGFTGYFQIYNMPFRYLYLFDYSEKKDIYFPGGINNGCPTFFDALRQRHIPFYLSDWRLPEEENIRRLVAEIQQGEIPFGYLYLAAMDAILHQYGTDHEKIRTKIEWYGRQLQTIVDLAKQKYDTVHLHVFSDHGMTNTVDTCDVMTAIQRLPLLFGKDYAAVYDSTMARFWFFSDQSREMITKVLEQEKQGRILSAETLRDYGCDFDNQKYGQLFFAMNPGVLLCPSFMGETRLEGMHGYDPYHKDSLAMFAANYVPESPPNRLDDLYGLMMQDVLP